VAKLLNKLMIQQTKSRPRHANDNGLAETNNGAIIRKHMGWGQIPAAHADPIQQFYGASLNPYLNYHRPCAQADVEVDAKGRKRRRYRRYQTPLETRLALPKPQQYLRPGLTVATLQRIGGLMSDTEAVLRMRTAKHGHDVLFHRLLGGQWGKRYTDALRENLASRRWCWCSV
jgi:hypothetical protein